MKKITAAFICMTMILIMAISSFADQADGYSISAEDQATADSLNIGSDAEACLDTVSELHANGIYVFDTIGLLDEEDKSELEYKLSNIAAETGFDLAVFTTDGYSGASDADDYSDLLYYGADLGTGEDKDGVILVINMDEREAYIYTSGIAIRYITDSMIDYIYDEYEGGIYGMLSEGDYEGACGVFADSMLMAYNEGIASDQTNYNTETGEYDPYVKKGIKPTEVLISLVISLLGGILPITNIKRKYAMKSEKRMAEGFNLAYRANAAYALANTAGAAKLLSKNVTRVPIVVNNNNNKGSGTHGGGVSSVKVGRSGGVHGGGGRKF